MTRRQRHRETAEKQTTHDSGPGEKAIVYIPLIAFDACRPGYSRILSAARGVFRGASARPSEYLEYFGWELLDFDVRRTPSFSTPSRRSPPRRARRESADW